MPHQSAKQQKIDIVMDEFKDGTLRSGGSNKKVTNPKQAIAIAMSEAERLAGGGYIGEPRMNEYMNRPMFQTPQMREGGGIMAGVAPVNMDEGGFMDWVSDTVEEYNPFPDDFWSTEKGGEGEWTARDITDLLIVDPEDPIDVGLAGATAFLMASGIGAPGALLTNLARMGYKGKKAYEVVNKATKVIPKEVISNPSTMKKVLDYTKSIPGKTIDPKVIRTTDGGQNVGTVLRNIGQVGINNPRRLLNPNIWEEDPEEKITWEDLNLIPEAVAEDEGGIQSLLDQEGFHDLLYRPKEGDSTFEIDEEGNINFIPGENVPEFQKLPYRGDGGFDIDEEGNITFTPRKNIPELIQPFMRYDDEESESIMEMLPRPSPTEETVSEGIESLIIDDDDKKKRRKRRDRLSKDTGWFPGKRILRGIRNIGDDERWLAADGGLAAPQHFAVGGIAKLTAKYGPEIGQTLKKVADQFGESSDAFKAILRRVTGDAQAKMLPKMSAETLGISSKATKKQREAAAKLKKTKEKTEAKVKKAKQEEPLPPVEPELKPGMMAKMGRNKWKTAGGAGMLGLGAYSLYDAISGDDEEAPAEEVVEEKMTVTEQVDEPRQWREIFTNLGDLPGEFRDTIVNSMDRIKEDPVYRRAMLAAFRAMTTPQAGYVPFNSLSEAVGAYYSEMDAIEGRKSEFELTKEALSDAYPDLSEGELTKMALGRSKSDYIQKELSLFSEAYPNANIMEATIPLDPNDDDSEKISQYDLIAQRAQALEDQGII